MPPMEFVDLARLLQWSLAFGFCLGLGALVFAAVILAGAAGFGALVMLFDSKPGRGGRTQELAAVADQRRLAMSRASAVALVACLAAVAGAAAAVQARQATSATAAERAPPPIRELRAQLERQLERLAARNNQLCLKLIELGFGGEVPAPDDGLDLPGVYPKLISYPASELDH